MSVPAADAPPKNHALPCRRLTTVTVQGNTLVPCEGRDAFTVKIVKLYFFLFEAAILAEMPYVPNEPFEENGAGRAARSGFEKSRKRHVT